MTASLEVEIGRRLAEGKSLWLIGDVHSNAEAVRAVLERIPPDDALIWMGDLLSYGPEPQRTLDLVSKTLERSAVGLLLGNHDEFYGALEAPPSLPRSLPDWIRESIEWTATQVDRGQFAELPWQREIVVDELLFSHANPFGPGDWSYLDTEQDYQRAVDRLERRQLHLGSFAHVHRPRLYTRQAGNAEWLEGVLSSFELLPGAVVAWNVASLGQPRHSGGSLIGCLRRPTNAPILHHHHVEYDKFAHLAALERTELRASTKERLAGYFKPTQINRP